MNFVAIKKLHNYVEKLSNKKSIITVFSNVNVFFMGTKFSSLLEL